MKMNHMDGMDEDIYGEHESKASPKSVDDQTKEMTTTSLVSLKVLTGKDGEPPKVGEERVVKVVAIHGDEAEIEYAPEKTDEEEDGMDEDEQLEEMNSKY